MKNSSRALILISTLSFSVPVFAQDLCGTLTKMWAIPPSTLGEGMANYKIFILQLAHSKNAYRVEPDNQSVLHSMNKFANAGNPVCLEGKFSENDSPEAGALPGESETVFDVTSINANHE